MSTLKSARVFAAVGYHGFYLGFEGKYQLYLHFTVRLHSGRQPLLVLIKDMLIQVGKMTAKDVF